IDLWPLAAVPFESGTLWLVQPSSGRLPVQGLRSRPRARSNLVPPSAVGMVVRTRHRRYLVAQRPLERQAISGLDRILPCPLSSRLGNGVVPARVLPCKRVERPGECIPESEDLEAHRPCSLAP